MRKITTSAHFPINPDDFYHTVETSEPQYQSDPTGGTFAPTPSISRGRAMYTSTNGASVYYHNFLIYNGFLNKAGNPDERLHQLRTLYILHELRNLGFEIFVLIEGRLAALSHRTITTLFDGLIQIDECTDNRLRELGCKTWSVRPDQITVLNDNTMDRLLKNQPWISLSDVTESATIWSRELNALTPTGIIKKIQDSQNAGTLKIALGSNNVSGGILRLINDNVIHCDDNTVFQVFDTMSIDETRFVSIDPSGIDHLIVYDGCNETVLTDLIQKTRFSVDFCSYKGDISGILKLNSTLQCLKLRGECSDDEILLTPSIQLLEIEVAYLTCRTLSSGTLTQLVILRSEIKLPFNFNFPQLQILKVSECTDIVLNSALQTSSHLKELTIGAAIYPTQNFQFTRNAYRLDELTTLSIIQSDIPISNFNILFESARHLKKFVAISYHSNDHSQFLGNFSELEEVYIRDSSLSPWQLESLLKNSCQLKKITLINCFHIKKQQLDDILQRLNLSHVECIYESPANVATATTARSNPGAVRSTSVTTAKSKAGAAGVAGNASGVNRPGGAGEAASSETPPAKALDANTKNNPFESLGYTRIFHSKHPFLELVSDFKKIPLYRLDVNDRFTVNTQPCSDNNAFTLHRIVIDDADLVPVTIIPSPTGLSAQFDRISDDENKHYRATKQISLGVGEIVALPSLSPHEKLLHWHIEPHSIHIHIFYSHKDNRYYLKNTGGVSVETTVDFIIAVPNQLPPVTIPPDIQADIDECKKFGGSIIGEKLNVPPNATGVDYFQEMKRKKIGACRHRALVFMEKMQEKGIPVRYMESECHAYAEIQIRGCWITCDLGGSLCIPKISLQDKSVAMSSSAIQTQSRALTAVLEGASEEAALYDNAEKDYFPSEPKPEKPPLSNYLRERCTKDKKYLIKVNGKESIAGLAYHLQKDCHEHRQPFFYANHPDDLLCASPYNDQGLIRNGPGGRLYKFLTSYENNIPAPVIIVNFDNFKPADFAKFNTIFDTERKIDGIKIPENMVVIGLIDPYKPSAYHDTSFYSRLTDAIADCPFSAEELAVPNPFVNTSEVAAVVRMNTPRSFNCHELTEWKDHLLGHLCLNGRSLQFMPGELFQALDCRRITEIEIINPPKNAAEFLRFWQEAKLKGYFEHEGHRVPIPPNFKINLTYKHDFSNLPLTVCQGYPPPDNEVLNETEFQEFLFHDVVVGKKLFDDDLGVVEGSLTRHPGILEKCAAVNKKTINVYLSDNLDLNTWSRFFEACEKNHVVVNLFVAPGVTLPREFNLPSLPTAASPLDEFRRIFLEENELDDDVTCIESSDRDVTVQQLKNKHKDAIVIDVSEMSANDLLIHINGEFICEGHPKFIEGDFPHFEFTQKSGALLAALKENKTVILHGTFQPALQHKLTDFLFCYLYKRREQKYFKREQKHFGKLVLVSETKKPFQSLVETQSHTVTVDEKRKILFPDPGEVVHWPLDRIARHSLTELQAMKREELIAREKENSRFVAEGSASHLGHAAMSRDSLSAVAPFAANRQGSQHNLRRSSAGWAGMLTAVAQTPTYDYTDLNNAKEKAAAFNQERLNAVEAVLSHSPFVFLAGISGVGKTTFVEKLAGTYLGRIFPISQLREWAKCKDNHYKILFIDEANITQRDWSEFEGLLHNPPTIIIDGELIELSTDHKVIFAGNPVSYSKDRRLPNFLKRHGNSVWFETLPPAYLYHEILNPVLKGTTFEAQSETIARPILAVAEFLTACSVDEVLITPRELAMMALLTMRYCDAHRDANPAEVAKYYAYQLAVNFVPASKRVEFHAKFNPTFLPAHDLRSNEADKFLLTDTNKPSAHLLDDFLKLRKYRRETQTLNDIQKRSGLGGFTLEGEPGLGKSDLAVWLLKANGLKEDPHRHEPLDANTYFYKIESTWSVEQKAAFLIKAWDAGAVVIWDEINSSASMERLLNDLLMGVYEGRPAKKPGFLLIGTQNPEDDNDTPGRQKTSPAMRHRMHYRVLPHYSEKATFDIVHKLGLPEKQTTTIISQYQKSKKTKKLCFRHLVEAAKKEITPDDNDGVLTKQHKAQLKEQRELENKIIEIAKKQTLTVNDQELIIDFVRRPSSGSHVYEALFSIFAQPYFEDGFLITFAQQTHYSLALEKIAAHSRCDDSVISEIVKNPNVSSEALRICAQKSSNEADLRLIANHKKCDATVIKAIIKNRMKSYAMLSGVDFSGLTLAPIRKDISYARLNDIVIDDRTDLRGVTLEKLQVMEDAKLTYVIHDKQGQSHTLQVTYAALLQAYKEEYKKLRDAHFLSKGRSNYVEDVLEKNNHNIGTQLMMVIQHIHEKGNEKNRTHSAFNNAYYRLYKNKIMHEASVRNPTANKPKITRDELKSLIALSDRLGVKKDLSGFDLTGLDLCDLDLSSADLSQCTLNDVTINSSTKLQNINVDNVIINLTAPPKYRKEDGTVLNMTYALFSVCCEKYRMQSSKKSTFFKEKNFLKEVEYDAHHKERSWGQRLLLALGSSEQKVKNALTAAMNPDSVQTAVTATGDTSGSVLQPTVGATADVAREDDARTVSSNRL